MLRSIEAKKKRQEALRRRRNQEAPDGEFLTINQCARRLKISRSTAHRLFGREPGVERLLLPGRRRALPRVPRAVFERVLRRAENPQR